MPEITDAMVDAAREEWRKHAAPTHEEADGTWTWGCDCGAIEAQPHRDSSQAWDEADRHEFRATVEAALAAAPKVTLPEVFAYEIGHDDGVSDASGGTVIDAWPQWWCPTCGTRYADGTVHDGLCGDGHELQPVTLQLVTRSTT